MPARKLSACGFTVLVDLDGLGFDAIGQVDGITPWGRSKVVIDTPILDCAASAEVGKEEQSTLVVTQYFDPHDPNMVAIDTNFDASLTNPDVKDIAVQLVSPSYSYDGIAAATAVTEEATCQIQQISREELTPDGYYKRQITFLRKGAITRTVA